MLTEYSEAGAMGFVLNHQSEYMLGDLLPDTALFGNAGIMWRAGRRGYFAFYPSLPEKIDGGIEIAEGIYWGGDFEKVKELVTNYQLTEDEIKFFAGYSGWTPGQLEDEIDEDTWIVTDKFNPRSYLRRMSKTCGRKW